MGEGWKPYGPANHRVPHGMDAIYRRVGGTNESGSEPKDYLHKGVPWEDRIVRAPLHSRPKARYLCAIVLIGGFRVPFELGHRHGGVALSAIGFAATGYALASLSREFELFERAIWAVVAILSLVLMLALFLMLARGPLVPDGVPGAAFKGLLPDPWSAQPLPGASGPVAPTVHKQYENRQIRPLVAWPVHGETKVYGSTGPPGRQTSPF